MVLKSAHSRSDPKVSLGKLIPLAESCAGIEALTPILIVIVILIVLFIDMDLIAIDVQAIDLRAIDLRSIDLRAIVLIIGNFSALAMV